MRRWALDLLVCPRCGEFPLLLIEHEVKNVKTRMKIKAPLCSSYCFLTKSKDISLDKCARCIQEEVVSGEILCEKCGFRMSVHSGVLFITDFQLSGELSDLKTRRKHLNIGWIIHP
jgi:uncharacterized protein YbaR (Trm112 family)